MLLPYKLTRDFQNDPMKLEQIYEVNYTKEEYEAKIQYTQKGCNAGLLQNGLIVIQRTNCHFLGHALCEANGNEINYNNKIKRRSIQIYLYVIMLLVKNS